MNTFTGIQWQIQMQIHLNIFKSRQREREREKKYQTGKNWYYIYMYVRDKEKKNDYIVIEKRMLGPFIAYFELMILLFLLSLLFIDNTFLFCIYLNSQPIRNVNIVENHLSPWTRHTVFFFLFSGTFRMASNQNPTKTNLM